MESSHIPDDVRKVLEEARRNTQPRKHHIVPKSYLERWSVDGVVRVHLLDEGRSFLTKPAKAARETDYYSAASDDLDPEDVPPMIFETILSRVEGAAVAAIDGILELPSRVDLQARVVLATFMAFQRARGHRQRLIIRATAHFTTKLMTQGWSEEQIRARLAEIQPDVTDADVGSTQKLLDELHRDEVQVMPQDAQAISMAFSAAELTGGLLFTRPWVIASTPTSLITTDEPVHPIPGPGYPRNETGGLGHAGIVVFPLSPDRLLLAIRPDLADLLGLSRDLERLDTTDLDFAETFSVCKELLMGATRWAFERSDRKVASNMNVPAKPDDLSTDEFFSIDDDGTSIIRFYSHNRWKNADLIPEWPLSGFWPRGWRANPPPRDLMALYEEKRKEAVERMRHSGA